MLWLWLILYGAIFAVPRALVPDAQMLLTPALLTVFWAALIAYLRKKGAAERCGLCMGARLPLRDAVLMLPLFIIAVLNVAFGGTFPALAPSVYMLYAVFGEEFFFRGVLQSVFLKKLGTVRAALAATALFALVHMLNALGGSPSDALVQALCAFGAGLLLAAVRIKTGSIFLPLLAHAAINLTAAGQAVGITHTAAYIEASALCAVCAILMLGKTK